MNSVEKSAEICVKSKQGIEFRVCKITHIVNEDETFKFIFEPHYEIISMTDYTFFQGIPGLDLDLRREKYIRENMIPCFISERVPQSNREDLYELLAEVGLDYIDPIEYLLRTKYQYSGDKMYLRQVEEKKNVYIEELSGKNNTSAIMKSVMSNLAKGNNVYIDNRRVEEFEYRNLYKMISLLYEKNMSYQKQKQIDGIALAKEKNKYTGRKPIDVDMLVFRQKLEQVDLKIITPKEAAKQMGISIDKYYRLKKKI